MSVFPHDYFWVVGGDETKFWSTAAGAYVEELPDNWFPTIQAAVDGAPGDGGIIYVCTHIASESELDAVLEPYGLLGPTARRRVKKSTVQARLISLGKMEEAHALLVANPVYFARWFAPDHPDVYADDPDAIVLLQALNVSVEYVMGPGDEV